LGKINFLEEDSGIKNIKEQDKIREFQSLIKNGNDGFNEIGEIKKEKVTLLEKNEKERIQPVVNERKNKSRSRSPQPEQHKLNLKPGFDLKMS